jgi:hypothetical protein
MANNKKWIVRLGESEWMRHTYARAPGEWPRLLGSVRHGAQVGALGQTEQGDFVQLVGDYEVPLSRTQITKAMAHAVTVEARPVRPMRVATTPVVIVKKRRVLVPA